MTIDAQLLADLGDPRAYPHRPARVDVVQTHISCVFLAGDEVFKVKKSVCFSFLDFSTLALRRRYCEEEVRLNRRLAPDVYRGVVPIVRAADGYRIGGRGDAVEYAVHMRRLPDDRLLRTLLARGEADVALMERIAVKMAAFHISPATVPVSTESAAPEAIARTLDETFTALGPHLASATATEDACGGLALAEVRALAHAALSRVTDVLRRRRASGRVRDGHGDLRPDHVCCTETLPILDCVEFSAGLRTCDVASEMAFLASELEFLAAPALADALIAAYARASGDDELPLVVPFFRVYRALVRAMVAALTAAEPEVAGAVRARQRVDAGRYLALTARRAWTAQGPLLIAVLGPSGSGKSTLASALAATTGFPVVRSDVLRKRLLGLEPLARPTSDAEVRRLYGRAHSDAVYAALGDEAARVLRGGGAVIVDATFQRRADRDRMRAVAAAARVPLVWIMCEAAAATVDARLRERARRDDDPSDATAAIANEQARTFEPLDEGSEPRLVLATDVDADPSVTACRWLARHLPRAADAFTTRMDPPRGAC